MAYIELVQVTKRFGEVNAVDRLDLGIEKGECVAMLGPSGCGKTTTTLRMVAGFEDLDDGEIRVGDRVLSSKRTHYYLPPEQRNFGMVFQAFAVWPAPDHLRERCVSAARSPASARRGACTHRGGAAPYQSPERRRGLARRPVGLAAKQRVALARALAIRPDVMLLDEPLSSLDPPFP